MIPNKISSAKKYSIILLVILVSLFAVQIFSQPNIISMSINPENATSTQKIECTWTVTGEETVNVTWYNNSVVFNSSTSVSSPWGLPVEHTTKTETWNCTVIAINNSAAPQQVVDSDRVTIDNAAPNSLYIRNTSGQDIGSIEHILEGRKYTFYHVATDPDDDVLTYSVLQSSYCSINSGTGEITCNSTSEPNLTTNDKFDFLVTDDDKFAGETLYINVTPTNDRPQFSSALTDETIEENQTLQYTFSMDDEEDPDGPFTVNISSQYLEEGAERLENITFDNDEFIIQFRTNRTSDYPDRGNWTVYITACDPQDSNLCTNGNFNLEVVPKNQRPNITNISYVPKSQGQLFTLYVNATDEDPTDTLTFSVSSSCGIPNPWSIETTNNSANATGLINITLTNNHIICRNITITVQDNDLTSDEENVSLLVTNVNDNPIIYNLSYYAVNTQSNIDIRNLTAYTNVSFKYRINGTDPDLLSDSNEVLTFYDNSSDCNGNCPTLTLNSSDGTVRFRPNVSSLNGQSSQMYYYEINLTDNYGASYVTIMNITIYNNTPPYFSPALLDQTATERTTFTYDIDAVDDQNDPINYSDNSSLFNINNSGVINFTPVCNNIGNYSIKITISDDKGAFEEGTFALEIQNAQDPPVISTLENVTFIETKTYGLDLASMTSDLDVDCSEVQDSHNFSSEFLEGTELFGINSTTGIVSYTPNASSQGNYLVRFYVTDTFGLLDTVDWNITIVNRTKKPIIHNVTPYGYPTVFNWTTVVALGANFTTINITENTTVNFDHNSTDPDGNELTFNWTVDGTLVSTSKSYSHDFDFASSGLKNVTLKVSDLVNNTVDYTVAFTWNVSVRDLNRPPEINYSLPNITGLNRTREITDYLYGKDSEKRFFDPDGDTLTYNWTSSSIVSISVSGNDATFTPEQVGVDTIFFTASDGSASVTSNNITVNVTSIPEPEGGGESTTVTSGSSSSSPIPYSVIQEVEKEKEIYLDIIVPEPVTVYRNNTVRQVIRLVNSGNSTLRGIYLSAETNSTSDAEVYFSDDYFPELLPGNEERTDLVVTAYKLLNHYEIIIWANVTNPEYKDKAVVYVNAIEKSQGNQSVTSTKITFARDLLNSNPECLELNEFLKQAQQHMQRGQYDRASDIIDSVIQGCKYLVSRSKLQDESPTGWAIGLDLDKIPYIRPILIIFTLSMIAAIVLTIRARKINQTSEEE